MPEAEVQNHVRQSGGAASEAEEVTDVSRIVKKRAYEEKELSREVCESGHDADFGDAAGVSIDSAVDGVVDVGFVSGTDADTESKTVSLLAENKFRHDK